MTPSPLVDNVIVPALALLPVGFDSRPARALLAAMALHTSTTAGFWPITRPSLAGLIQSSSADDLVRMVAREHKLGCNAALLARRAQVDALLSCRLARLLLWIDRAPLPEPTPEAEAEAYAYYARTLRPVDAHDPAARVRWSDAWNAALEAVNV